MEIQQRISRQRIHHIIDSYLLADTENRRFNLYLDELLSQYPSGLIELALIETLAKSWLSIPMQKGIPFLAKAHNWLKQWRLENARQLDDSDHHTHPPLTSSLSPSQFSQITGLDPQVAFAALAQPTALTTQSAIE